MRQPFRFWADLLRGCLRDRSLPEFPPDTSVDQLVESGKRLHLLEWLDWAVRNRETPPDYPEPLRESAREQRRRTAVWNRRFREFMGRVEERAPSGLDWAWLKGAALLAEGDYPRAVRRLSDLDLLIRKSDLETWHRVLTDCGYTAHRDPGWILDEEFSDAVSSAFYTVSDRGRKQLLDLHWHLVDFPARRAAGPWDFEVEPVWERVREHRLAPEHRLLYASDHAFSHGYKSWKFLADLLFVLRRYRVDVEFLAHERNRMGQRAIAEMSLRLFEQVLGTPLPAGCEPLVSGVSRDLTPLQIRFVQRALDGENREGDYLKVCLELCRGLRSKIHFLAFVLLPPPSAVPRLSEPGVTVQSMRTYLERCGRVLRRGGRILLGV